MATASVKRVLVCYVGGPVRRRLRSGSVRRNPRDLSGRAVPGKSDDDVPSTRKAHVYLAYHRPRRSAPAHLPPTLPAAHTVHTSLPTARSQLWDDSVGKRRSFERIVSGRKSLGCG
ncbi:hypothetical protein Bbelb_217730 [Branchiostoma belcheri]|nr:hypothetical protein Bbelb_217730 [Branchiostoma belcheri]